MVKLDFTYLRKYGTSKFILIPARLIKDLSFPFKENEDLVVEIKGKKLEVRKA